MPSQFDRRRLNDGARAMGLNQPKTLAEMEEQLRVIGDGALAMQSLDDLGSPEANKKAWDDMIELQARYDALEKKIKEIKNKK